MTAITELARKIKIEQAQPIDEANESDDARLGRWSLEDEWIGGITYKGNSVSWTHSKAENYKKALLAAWGALTELGVPCDGKTTVADAIRQYCRKE